MQSEGEFDMAQVTLKINGTAHTLEAPPDLPLLDLLLPERRLTLELLPPLEMPDSTLAISSASALRR